MALGFVDAPTKGGGTTGGGGTAGNTISPFNRLPSPPSPPVITPPIKPPAPPGGGGTAGTVGRVLTTVAPVIGRRFPIGGVVAGLVGGALIGWGLSNSKPKTTRKVPPTTNTTSWNVKTGPGRTWQVRIRGFGGENFGQAHLDYWRNWLAPNQKYENGTWTSGDWLAEGGGELVTFVTTSEQVGYPINGYNFLTVEVETTSTTGQKKRWRMGDFGTSHEVEIYPKITLPGGGEDAFPLNPPPYTPPPLKLPDPNETKKDTKPKPPALVPTPAGPIQQPRQPERLPEPETEGQPKTKPPQRPPIVTPAQQNPTIPGSKQKPGIGTGSTEQKGPADNNDPGPSKKPFDRNEPGPDGWELTDPTEETDRIKRNEPPGPVTPKTQTTLKDGTKLDPPPVPPTPDGTARELAKLERKMEIQLENMGSFLKDLVNLLSLVSMILELLQASDAERDYTITAPCKEPGEQTPRTETVTAPGATSLLGVALNRIDAIAELIRLSQMMTVKTCGRTGSTPTNNVTVTAYEVME